MNIFYIVLILFVFFGLGVWFTRTYDEWKEMGRLPPLPPPSSLPDFHPSVLSEEESDWLGRHWFDLLIDRRVGLVFMDVVTRKSNSEIKEWVLSIMIEHPELK